MQKTSLLLDYGVLGIFCFILITALSALFWLGWRANKAHLKELKEDREFRMEVMRQLMINNNRLIENNNEMMKGFIDIVASFKALLNIFVELKK